MTTAVQDTFGNLPIELTSFVDRRSELTELRRMLSASPLVTVTGPGGIGKTRLVVRSAASVRRAFPDGVWLVELSELEDPSLLDHAVFNVLGVLETSTQDPRQRLAQYLAGRRLLLLLDGCEHVVEAVAGLADALLRRCPDLRILATSREPLGIDGETILRLTPLAVPDPDRQHSRERSARFAAVTLFTERAGAAVSDFDVTDQNHAAVVRICHRLDGLPLAIELAAARLGALSPEQIADRLADRYQLLTTGSRAAPTRHQTMRLCVDWSYHLCLPAEQVLWARLSAFAGGFELDAAESICAFGDLPTEAILDVVAGLVDKSILTREESGPGLRFRLLETLRDYGSEKLDEAGGFAEYAALRRRHRDWYLQLVLQAERDWIGRSQVALIDRLDREHANLRAALNFSLTESGEASAGLVVARALYPYWISRGLLDEGRRWIERALALTDGPGQARVEALYSAAGLAGMQGDVSAASALVQECREVGERLGNPLALANVAHAEGVLGLFTGDLSGAAIGLERAVDGYRASGDLNRLVDALIWLALANGLLGKGAQAVACHEQVLAITEPRGEAWFQSYSLWACGLAAWQQSDLERAADLLMESLRLKREVTDLLGSVWCMEALAFIASAEQHKPRAAVLLGAAAALSHESGTPSATFPALLPAYATCIEDTRRVLGQQAYETAFAQGKRMSLAGAVAYALGEQGKATEPRVGTQILTRREREIAELVTQGMTNKEIASRLVISARTVAGHVEHILTKLGFKSRVQIAGWVSDQEKDNQHQPLA
jgi:predicted ATPase/DNA-binding NarL/FixJ family response regulator